MINKLNIELIHAFINANNLSVSRFCKLSKISYKTYIKIMSGQTNFRVLSLFKIARAINIPVHKMFA